jgi:hypothetical protein
MERILMIWDEIDDLRAFLPRVLTGTAGIAMIIAAIYVTRI